jgi:hypothetical protein
MSNLSKNPQPLALDSTSGMTRYLCLLQPLPMAWPLPVDMYILLAADHS